MPDLNHFQKLITDRLVELDVRIHEVDHELGEPKSADLNEQAIDIEDDEVALLKTALKRIKDGSYGICQKCEESISEARLEAVPYAPLCKRCAQQV
jgi:DnaK suppressor protein